MFLSSIYKASSWRQELCQGCETEHARCWGLIDCKHLLELRGLLQHPADGIPKWCGMSMQSCYHVASFVPKELAAEQTALFSQKIRWQTLHFQRLAGDAAFQIGCASPASGPSCLICYAGGSHDLNGLCLVCTHHVHRVWTDICGFEAAQHQERCQKLA